MKRARGALLAFGLALGSAAGAAAQRTLVVPEPGAPMVALAVDLNAGGIWDPVTQAGVSRLAAEALLQGLRPELRALSATGSLQCDRFGLRLTLLAPPSTWRAAGGLVLDAFFQPTLQAEALDTARARLLRSLRFQQGDPSAEIRTAIHEALFGEGHRWARGACGTPETLDSVTLEDAQAAATARFQPDRGAAALTGPIAEQDGAALLARSFGDARLPTLLPLPDPPPLPGSRDVETPTITVWLAVAYVLPRDVDDEATRLLAQRVLQDVGPAPDRPRVVDASAEVERFGGGGALVIYMVVEPTDARAWVARVQQSVDSLAAAPMDAGSFELLRRRYRGARLLELASPEQRAADAADRLFFDRGYQPLERRISALTAARLQAAAVALGPPAVAYLGPEAAGGAALDRQEQHR